MCYWAKLHCVSLSFSFFFSRLNSSWLLLVATSWFRHRLKSLTNLTFPFHYRWKTCAQETDKKEKKTERHTLFLPFMAGFLLKWTRLLQNYCWNRYDNPSRKRNVSKCHDNSYTYYYDQFSFFSLIKRNHAFSFNNNFSTFKYCYF